MRLRVARRRGVAGCARPCRRGQSFNESDGAGGASISRQRARSCIFLYMPGGPSQIDLFDPKPEVTKYHGQPLPIEKPKLMHSKTTDLFGSLWKFDRHGRSGIEVSRLLPHIAGQADELCVIRSMVADNINHTGAALQMNTGEQAFSRPEPRLLGDLWIRKRKRQLAGFRGHRPEASVSRSPAVEFELPTGLLSRNLDSRLRSTDSRYATSTKRPGVAVPKDRHLESAQSRLIGSGSLTAS